MEQLFMFDVAPGTAATTRTVVRRSFGPAPKQREMRIKLLRKIAFKQRHREIPGIGDNHRYTADGIMKIHQYLLNEWKERFPVSTNLLDQIDYWSWMLGDPAEPLSFRDCLVADGYPRPDEVIEGLEERAPEWFKAIRDLPPVMQVNYLKKLVESTGSKSAAVRAA